MKWLSVRLERLISMYGGGTPSKQNPSFWKGDIPWVSPKDMSVREIHDSQDHITQEAVEKSTTQLVPAGSVLVVVRSGILVRKIPIGIAQRPLAINQDMKALVPNQAVLDSRFLSYFLESNQQTLLTGYVKRGATVHSLQVDKLKSMIVQLPPTSEQRRIVEILDEAASLSRRRVEADASISRIIPTLFHKMFGDLISNSCGWKKEPITKLCVKEDGIKCGPFGTQLSNKEYQQEGVPLWGIKHVNAGFVIKTTEFISQEKADYLEGYRILPDDIIMTRKGTVGNCSVYPDGYPTGIMHSDLLRIRVNRKKASPSFLAFQLKLSPAVINQIATISGGAVMAGINVTRLKSLVVHVPPLEKQVQFEQHAMETLRLLERIRHTQERISRLFDFLLHRAFTGDLTAKWREAHMKELLTEMEHQQSCLEMTK